MTSVNWPLNNTFPLSGFAFSAAETYNPDMNETTYTEMYNGTDDTGNLDLDTTVSDNNFIRIPFSMTDTSAYNKYNPNNVGPYGIFADYPNSMTPSTFSSTFIQAFIKIVNTYPTKVFMLDAHNYLQYYNVSDDTYSNYYTSTQLGEIWVAFLDLVKNNYSFNINDHNNIFLELQNEPINLGSTGFNFYQIAITQIRNAGYSNKIVMGGPQSTYGKFVNWSTPLNITYNFGTDYSLGFPTDPSNNLAITLHNYLDYNGSGTDYTNQLSLNQTINIFTSNIIVECLANINSDQKIDLIYGEFGFPNSNNASTNYSDAVASNNYVLNLMNDSRILPESSYKGSSITPLLTQSYGYFLGFSAWTICILQDTDQHSISQLQTDSVYSQFISNTTLCYLKGTLILTNKGYVPIENIKERDQIITNGHIQDRKLDNSIINTEPVLWISSFKVNQLDSESRPIRIQKHAICKNQPFKDLYVSPNHGLIIHNKLVNARDLVNGYNIYQDTKCSDVEYYHLEFNNHSAIYANGMLAESYYDVNSRYVFKNKKMPLHKLIEVE